MQWAQEGSGSSSSSSDDDEAPMLASLLTSQHRRGGATGLPSPGGSALLPSPVSFGGAASSAAAPSSAIGKGVMDRYMSDRPPTVAAAPEAAVPSLFPSSTASTSTSTALPAHSLPAIPASPVRKAVYPPHSLLSPMPSRPKAGVLFSPDVAKLLRSELDELEANELAGRSGGSGKSSPRKGIDRSSDIVRFPSLSPFPTRRY